MRLRRGCGAGQDRCWHGRLSILAGPSELGTWRHYRLHLENRGKEIHEFTAPTFFAAAKLDNPEALNREHTEIVVQPGESKDVFFTPGAPGAYDLRCGDHDWAGMVGGITVR
jgi:uncharacterized cupredoxin-like copper-binding protein